MVELPRVRRFGNRPASRFNDSYILYASCRFGFFSLRTFFEFSIIYVQLASYERVNDIFTKIDLFVNLSPGDRNDKVTNKRKFKVAK